MTQETETAVEAELPEVVETEAVIEQAEAPETEAPAEERRLTEAEWQKKLENAENRAAKRLNRLRRDIEAAKLEATHTQRTQPTPSAQTTELKEPQPQDFPSDYTGYLRAVARFDRDTGLREVEQRLTAKETASVQQYREQQLESQRDAALDAAGAEYAKQVPNFDKMVADNAQTIKNFPDSIKRVIKEVDPQDVVKAFHVMVENDTLEDLADMTPVQAAAAIVKAASMPIKPVITKAPNPMAAARGMSAGSKTLNRMSPQELVDWVNS